MEKKKLKRIEFRIDDTDTGKIVGEIESISIVKDPAIEQNFEFFSKEGDINIMEDFNVFEGFSVQNIDEDKQEISGPVMIPNLDIPRKNKKTGEMYYAYFTADTIKKCMQYYFKSANNTKTNFDHQDNFFKSVYAFESWIKISENDKSKDLFKNIEYPIDSWFATIKIEDKNMWEQMKKEGFKGFSIQGRFQQQEPQKFDKDIDLIKEIKELLNKEDIINLKKLLSTEISKS